MRSIERPAALVWLRFSSGLVNKIAEEVGADECNLPPSQHALERTWRHRSGPLSAAEQNAERRLFLRLLWPGDGSAHVRLRAGVAEDPVEKHVMDIASGRPP